MSIVIFLLLISICLGIVYLIHKYLGKEQFYLFGIVCSILSFIVSFKLISIFGININFSIIFTSTILLILYYFVNRYDNESRRFIYTILLSTLVCISLFLLVTFMAPSIYDKVSTLYQYLAFENLAIVVLYPLSLAVTLFLSEYAFKELKKENKYRLLKTMLTIIGIVFIDTAIFIYFSYAFIIRFDTAIKILVDNYLVKTIIMIIFIYTASKLFMVRKVK